MITGYDLAEYLFSNQEDEERLYSTGDEELDELLERAFSEGYEYAQREFGEKLDKADIWVAKHLNPKWINEGYIAMSEEDDEGISKFGKRNAVVSGALGGVSVGALAKGLGMKNKGALAAGLATGVLGSGASYGGHKLGTSLRKNLRKKNEKYDREWKKVGDKARVGRGLMTEEEYRKKWYNK